VTPIAWHRGGHRFWRTKHLVVQLARSLCLVVATVLFFSALRYVPLAEGSAINFLVPIFAVLLAAPVLGERPTRARWMASIGGFVGILILVRPGAAMFQPASALIVLGAVANALYQLLTRKVPRDHPMTTLFYSALAGAVGLTLALPFAASSADFTIADIGFLVLLGLFAGLGHWLLISAYLAAPASLLAPFTYLQIIWATLYGYVLFAQLPDGVSAIGIAIIVASGVALVLHERRPMRR
jgi:drug/metabolite transporter (DMT)-like permease